MLKRLGHSIYLERRRMAFLAVLSFFAGALTYARSDLILLGTEAWKVTSVIYVLVIVPLSLLFCLIAPRTRFLIEAIAVARLGLAIAVFMLPTLGYWVAKLELSVSILLVLAAALLSRHVLHGRMVTERKRGFKARLASMSKRRPARLERPTPLQRRFTAWIDGTQPICL